MEWCLFLGCNILLLFEFQLNKILTLFSQSKGQKKKNPNPPKKTTKNPKDNNNNNKTIMCIVGRMGCMCEKYQGTMVLGEMRLI